MQNDPLGFIAVVQNPVLVDVAAVRITTPVFAVLGIAAPAMDTRLLVQAALVADGSFVAWKTVGVAVIADHELAIVLIVIVWFEAGHLYHRQLKTGKWAEC